MRAVRDARRDRRRDAVAAIALAVAVIVGTWLIFAKGLPGERPFEVRAEVPSANQVKEGNPVRIAGVDVGRVAGLEPAAGGRTAIVLELDKPELVRADASVAIAPRLLLEGNNVVELRPGTPGAPPIRRDATIPAARTAAPVQLDQVLTTLRRPVREALRGTLRELAAGLGPGPGGGTGAQGLRDAAEELEGALGSISRTATAMTGQRTGDLRRAVGGSSSVATQLAADPGALAGIVTSMRRVAGAMAARDRDLRGTVRELAGLVTDGPQELAALEAGLPHLDRLVAQARPSLRAAPAALRRTRAMLGEVRALAGAPELPGLLRDVRPVTANLPAAQDALLEGLPHATAVSRCVARNIVPTMDKEVPDGKLSSGRPAWHDMLHMAAALTGTSPGFDGNGGTLRLGIAEGPNAIRATVPGLGPLLSRANLEGVRPAWLGYGVQPQFRPDAPCAEQDLPDLAARNRDGLPAGFQRVAQPRESAEARERRRDLLRLLLGTDTDRRRLLRKLLGELPRKRPARQAPRREAPAKASPAPRRPQAGDEPARPEVPETLRKPLEAVEKALGDLLDPSPTGGLGRLLGGLLRPGGKDGGR